MNTAIVRVTDWKALSFDDRKREVADRWAAFQRGALADGWDIGRGLRATKDLMQHGEWLPYLSGIGMSASMALRLMALGEGYDIQRLGEFGNMDAALKALSPKRAKVEPAEPAAPEPTPTEPDRPTDAEGLTVMAEEFREHEEQRDHEAERDERDERLARRLEDSDGEAVDVLADKLDKADERHREDVRDINETRRVANAVMREKLKIRDALLGIPRDAEAIVVHQAIDDVLARFFNSARK